MEPKAKRKRFVKELDLFFYMCYKYRRIDSILKRYNLSQESFDRFINGLSKSSICNVSKKSIGYSRRTGPIEAIKINLHRNTALQIRRYMASNWPAKKLYTRKEVEQLIQQAQTTSFKESKLRQIIL